jgi:hypothetical protein
MQGNVHPVGLKLEAGECEWRSVRFWQAGLAALSGVVVSASAAEANSFAYVAPPKAVLGPSFATVREIPPPSRPAVASASPPRSPLDAPLGYEPAARPHAVSASIIAFGGPALRMPDSAPIPSPARRTSLVRADVAPVVIRSGMVGGAFPGAATPVAAASAPEPEPAKAPPRPEKRVAKREPSAPPPAPPAPPPAIPSAPSPDTLLSPDAARQRPK